MENPLRKYRGTGYTDKNGITWTREKNRGFILNALSQTAQNLSGKLYELTLSTSLWTSLDLGVDNNLDTLYDDDQTHTGV